MSSNAVDGWVPSPRHLLRLACIEDRTATWTPGDVLEVGAGTGHVSATFADRGFSLTLHDLGDTSRALLRDRFGATATVIDDLADAPADAFSYLFAFEVLEHIDDDRRALRDWVGHLAPGGQVLISVPAHRRKFGDTDRAVGHVRRYEKPEVEDLCRQAGLVDVEVANYGFPLGNVLRWAQTLLRMVTRRRADDAGDETERIDRTMDSGVRTASWLNRVRFLLRPSVFAPFAALQRLAYRRDWSDGYVVTARKAPTS